MTLVSPKNYRVLFIIILFIILQFVPYSVYPQEAVKTIVEGHVIDARSGSPLHGANVAFERSGKGTVTGPDGQFRIETSGKAQKLVFSFIGFQSEARKVIPGTSQIINVSLHMTPFALGEVKVRPGKGHYRNKNNPAVDLIRKVIENRDTNRIEKFDYLSYREYEKQEFALSNVKEKSGRFLKRYRFIFENSDTTKRVGQRTVPVYFREILSEKYYRKGAGLSREIILGEKTVDLDKYFDKNGITAKLEYLYQDIDIYDNEILFLKNKFISPISANAPLFYKYYIIDTLQVDDYRCISLFFEPRNKSDFLFQGYLYVTPDNNYAVRKADMIINKRANFNWIQGISVTQDFSQHGKNWFLSEEEVSADYGVFKNGIGLLGQRTVARTDFKTDDSVDKKVFSRAAPINRADVTTRSPEFWNSNRILPLENSEKLVYDVVDSLRKMPSFNRWMDVIMMFPNDYLNLGKIELGPEDSFFSSNPVEGQRFRAGGRTTPDFSKRLTFDGYAAYGLSDRNIKYRTGITYSLTPKTIYEFPVRSVSLAYEKDLTIPSQELELLEADNFFASFKRGVDDKYFLNRTARAEYLNEFENHFSFLFGYRYTRQTTEGNLRFSTADYLSENGRTGGIDISEFYLDLRYAPHETFYQRRTYRKSYKDRYPVFDFSCAAGGRSVGNDYDYVRLQLSASKRFYFSVLGYTDMSLEAGRILGQVSWPVLFLHRANQTYSYQSNSYNLMNFLEFVSDRYVSLNVDHCFNGFFLNKIPFINRLKLREVATCKILYGGLSASNDPDLNNTLMKFPVHPDRVPLMYSPGKQPYIEASVGLANILKVIRVDYVRRLSYLDHPGVSSSGIRLLFGLNI